MKELAILRHAKSSWAEAGVSDEDRQLHDRGYRQMNDLAAWLSRNSYMPDIIFCSTAKRTRQTYECLKDVLGSTEIRYEPKLYSGHMEDYLDIIWSSEDVKSILIIGHNPNCDELTYHISKPSGAVAEKMRASHFSSGTFARFNFDGEWSSIGEASCDLVEFSRPKDIQTDTQVSG